MLALSAIVTGLGLGAMYGLLALGFHVTYAVSRTVNFSQGSTMMLGAVLAYTSVSYTHLTLPTTSALCRSRWSPYD